MNLQNIRNIEVGDITPHPNNPREDLGDLSELAESIKKNGIMQNLTVIPCDTSATWIVVIGNRRLEAAKLAGLETVPCVVTEMDEKTQIATMLLENMQRNNLTVFEQAKGMQMMMNLGDSIADVCEKTGLAETTVRRRIKIAELDEDQVKEAISRQVTIKDFVKLEKIKDPQVRNEVLTYLGTSNFEWRYISAIKADEWKQRKAEIMEILSSFATELEGDIDWNGYRHVINIGSYNYKNWQAPEDKAETNYFFMPKVGGCIDLYTEREQTEDDTVTLGEENKEREQRQALKSRADELSSLAYELRRDFVLNHKYTNDDLKHIAQLCAKGTMTDILCTTSDDEMIDYLGLIDLIDEETEEFDYSAIKDEVYSNPMKYIVVETFAGNDQGRTNYVNWNGIYYKNEILDFLYEFLIAIGYEMSEEEKQLQDGTHEVFGDGEEAHE